MGNLTPSQLTSIKSRIKAEMTRRNGYGSLASYGTSSYDFSEVPAQGKVVKAEHGEKTIETLNVLDYDYYFRLIDLFLQNDVAQSLLIFNEILSKGFQGQNFVDGLSKHVRDLLVSKDQQTIVLLNTSEQTAQRYLEQAKRCTSKATKPYRY